MATVLKQSIRGPTGVQGVGDLIKSLHARREEMGSRLPKVLTRAAVVLLRESVGLVPVEYGPLKASGTVKTSGSGWNFRASVVYTASYAGYVHELIGMVLKGLPRPSGIGKYWGPRGQAKFLEEPARRLRPQLLQLIRDGMKVK